MNAEAKTILVVDDEKDIAHYLQLALEDAGFRVVTASSGVEAMEKVKAKAPDAISLDIVMPKGSGVKFFRELKQNPALCKIPTIIVTGHARDELGKADFQEMTLSGPGVYLEKPVTPETYVKAIKKILGIKESEIVSMKDEVKALLESADPKMLQEIFNILKSKNP